MNRTLLLILLLMSISANAQQKLSYAYDSAGNRVSRTIVMTARNENVDMEEDMFFEEHIADKQLKIYPNPVKEQLTIEITGHDSTEKAEYILLNMSGAVLKRDRISSEITTVDMNRFVTGTYVLNIIINGERTVWKIIKQ